MRRRFGWLPAAFLWIAAFSLLAGLTLGVIRGIGILQVNEYLDLGYRTAALSALQSALNDQLLLLLQLGALGLLVALFCALFRDRARALGLLVGIALAVCLFAWLAIEINRFRFDSYWVQRRELLGLTVRAALVEPRVLAANLGLLVGAAIAGWIVFRLVRALARRLRAIRLPVPWLPVGLLLVGLLVAVGINLHANARRSRARSDGPNLILISLDTLRGDNLGCYGYSREVSPRIDELASQSVLFENAITQAGSTFPSHRSLFTSRYPPPLTVAELRLFDRRHVTLAEVLLDQGWRTAAIVNGLGWVTPTFGFDQGFIDYTVADDRLRTTRDFLSGRRVDPAAALASAEEITSRALAWLQRHGRERFFLFLHYGDIHSDWGDLPYEVPAPYARMFLPSGSERFDRAGKQARGTRYLKRVNRGQFDLSPELADYLRALYDGGVRYTDFHIGHLCDELRRLGLLEKTMIVILSDHGEAFGEHGRVLHGMVYREIAHVPLIMRFPESRYAGARIGAQIELVDVMPTVLDQLGVPAPADMVGRSLLRMVATQDTVGRAFTVGGAAYAVRADGWMYRYAPADGSADLYHLAEDPWERVNVTGRYAKEESRLRRVLFDWLEEREAEAAREAEGTVQIGRETRQLLKSLGYLGDD